MDLDGFEEGFDFGEAGVDAFYEACWGGGGEER